MVKEYPIWLWGGDVEEYLNWLREKVEEYPSWLWGGYMDECNMLIDQIIFSYIQNTEISFQT